MEGMSSDSWELIKQKFDGVSSLVRRNKAVNITANFTRAQTREAVQVYFREARPHLMSAGLLEADCAELDAAFQNLNTLASGVNRKNSYARELKTIKAHLDRLDTKIHLLIGQRNQSDARLLYTPLQSNIITTLKALVPSGARSFEQALSDLADRHRVSHRGSAAELREVLREVVDHFAPDEDVMKSPGFQLEKDRRLPTMKQKVRFILRNRGEISGVAESTIDAAVRVDGGPEAIARSTYNRGSADTHVGATRSEVVALQRYAEAVLAELLRLT